MSAMVAIDDDLRPWARASEGDTDDAARPWWTDADVRFAAPMTIDELHRADEAPEGLDPWRSWEECPGTRRPSVGGGAGPTPVESTPLESLATRHRVAFMVLDGNGRAYPGIEYVLYRGRGELERGKLGGDATVRRDDVGDDDYELEIVGVDAVPWAQPSVDAGATATLHVRASGLDAESVEAWIFEELRERDEDVLLRSKATVRGGVAVLEIAVPLDRIVGLPGHVECVPLVAEVRHAGGAWAKTETPLSVVRPRIAAVAWSCRSAAVGEAVDLVVELTGVADGTTVALDAWRVPWAGDDEHLETLAEPAAMGGRATATWTPPGAGEYWFSATVSGDVLLTANAGLLVVG